MICNKCGRENDNESEYCSYCGMRIKTYNHTTKSMLIVLIIIIGIVVGLYSLDNYTSNEDSKVKVVKYQDIGNNMLFFKCPVCEESNYISNEKLIWDVNRYDWNEKTGLSYCLECNVALIFRPSTMTVTTRDNDKKIHNLTDEDKAKENVSSKDTSYNYEESLEEYKPWEKEREPGITGIEQAIKDGLLKDCITNGTSEKWLHFAWSEGGWLQYYYNSWEECLQDAKDLGILREPTEEELNALKSGI